VELLQQGDYAGNKHCPVHGLFLVSVVQLLNRKQESSGKNGNNNDKRALCNTREQHLHTKHSSCLSKLNFGI
jgi:hypothetical protein